MPPAKTGRERTNKKAVTTIDQVKREILSKLISTLRNLQKVAIKLTLLKIEPIPAICKLKMLKSILFPL